MNVTSQSRKRLNRTLALVVLVVAGASIWYFEPIRIGVYHDGVCGAQKWERHLFGLDFSEEDYDEFDIEARWSRAHKQPCKHIWIKGPLESDDGTYWPRLHLAVAKGVPISELERKVATSSPQSLWKKDHLGRTILHWLVVHPDREGRQRLITELVGKGLSLDEKDSDGFSPQDWENLDSSR